MPRSIKAETLKGASTIQHVQVADVASIQPDEEALLTDAYILSLIAADLTYWEKGERFFLAWKHFVLNDHTVFNGQNEPAKLAIRCREVERYHASFERVLRRLALNQPSHVRVILDECLRFPALQHAKRYFHNDSEAWRFRSYYSSMPRVSNVANLQLHMMKVADRPNLAGLPDQACWDHR